MKTRKQENKKSDGEDIRHLTMAELMAMRARGETGTLPDAPCHPIEEEFWTSVRVVASKGDCRA